MQFSDILLLLVSFGVLFFHYVIVKILNIRIAIGFLLFTIGVHLSVGVYRWQIIPIYVLWILALITLIRQNKSRSNRKGLKILKRGLLIILFAIAPLLPNVFPIFKLPKPLGPYKVGTTDVFLELDREEIITSSPDDKRRLAIKVWYPSNSTNDEMDPYADQGGRHGFAQKYGLPKMTFNYLDNIATGVYRNTPIVSEVLPVLIFSHGYNSKANSYYALLSELASQGYVIFAINHTYESTGTSFENGSEVYFDYNFAQKNESGTWEQLEPLRTAFEKKLPFDKRHPIVKKALTSYFVKDIVDRWALDIVDVIDHLYSWNQSGVFKNKLDLNNIGVFGHSRGGGAAGHSLLKDDRIKAGANIDGVQWGQIVDTTFQKPFLFISADWPEDHEDLNSHAYINKSNFLFYEAKIFNSAHSNFMDIPFMIPLKFLSQAGSIDPELGIEITRRLTTGFFNQHLKNIKSDFDTLDKRYDLLKLKITKGDSIRS